MVAMFIKSESKKPKFLSCCEAAYLAGLIDGEGSLFIQKTRIGRHTPTIRITNTDRTLVDLCNLYGGYWLCCDYTVKWKPVYRWILLPSL